MDQEEWGGDGCGMAGIPFPIAEKFQFLLVRS
jgi:hypothetical protein